MFASLKIKSDCQPPFWGWPTSNTEILLHNCQWDINNFEDTDLCLEDIYVCKLSLNAGAQSSVACERLKCHKTSRHVMLGTSI